MPIAWQDLRPEDFGPGRTAPLFDMPRSAPSVDELLAEPGSLFAPEPEPGPGRWWIVACSASKLDYPAPAAELYTGSMFTHSIAAAEAAAERAGGHVLILSAKYGLIRPEREIEPYDLKLGERNSADLLTVGRQAAALGMKPGDVVTTLLPKAYRELVRMSTTALGLAIGGKVELVDAYAGCRGIGEQRAANWRMLQAANNG